MSKVDDVLKKAEIGLRIIDGLKRQIAELNDGLEKLDRDITRQRDQLNKIQNNDAERDRLEKLEREAMAWEEYKWARAMLTKATHYPPPTLQ